MRRVEERNETVLGYRSTFSISLVKIASCALLAASETRLTSFKKDEVVDPAAAAAS